MVLLIIDTQQLITNEKLYNFEVFKKNVKTLIQSARNHHIEVIYVRHDDGKGNELTKGADGFEIYNEFKPMDKELIFDKFVNSPFKESGLLEYLKSKDIKEIIVVGLQTDYCIDATVKCAFEHGFQVYIPENTNTTVDNEFMSGEQSYHYYNDYIWNNRYAQCITIDKMLEYMIKNNE